VYFGAPDGLDGLAHGLRDWEFGRRRFQVVATGYTGAVAGDYPKSPWKIAGAVFVALLIAIVLLLLAQQR
jgi:hypothetical protein